jgi:histidine triad (HIT) family protein
MTYDKDNIFAKILRGEIPCNKVFENDIALAFHDINPAAATHVLVIPKGEYVSFEDFVTKAQPEVVKDFFLTVRRIAGDLGLDTSGYRLLMNHGADAMQTVLHFHVHILGGQKLGPLVVGDKHHL